MIRKEFGSVEQINNKESSAFLMSVEVQIPARCSGGLRRIMVMTLDIFD